MSTHELKTVYDDKQGHPVTDVIVFRKRIEVRVFTSAEGCLSFPDGDGANPLHGFGATTGAMND